MCSLCGALGNGPSWEQEGLSGAEARWRLPLEASDTAAELTVVLAQSRIKVKANADFGFLVAFPTGGTEIVGSLAEVWHALQRRRVAIPDPLDGP